MEIKFNIPTNTHIFHQQYLNIVNPLFGPNKLRQKEIQLLAHLHNLYTSLPDQVPYEIKCTSIFSPQSIKAAIESLNMSRSHFDAILKALINKGFIYSNNRVKTLKSDIILKLQPDTKVIFNFIQK